MTRWTMLLLATIGLGSTARAGTLVPAKASDLIVVQTQFDSCPVGGGRVLNYLNQPGGAGGPFTIPPGRVAVITDVQVSGAWIGGGPSVAGRGLQLFLERQTATTNQMVGVTSGTFDGGDQFAHTFAFPAGLVLRPGDVLCAVAFDTFATEAALQGVAHGFFTKDR